MYKFEQLVLQATFLFTSDILNLHLEIISVGTIRRSGINHITLQPPFFPTISQHPQPHAIPQTCLYVRMFISSFISHKEIAAISLPTVAYAAAAAVATAALAALAAAGAPGFDPDIRLLTNRQTVNNVMYLTIV